MVKIGEYEINHEDTQNEFWNSVQNNEWEPNTFKILKEHIELGKTFIDIGAWNGVLSLYAAKLGAICFAIEPDPKAFEYLEKNIKLNSDVSNKIEAYNVAISNDLDNAQLNVVGDLGNSMSSLVDRKEGSYCEVLTWPLNDFIFAKGIDMQDVCLLKIDTEGSEVLIIPSIAELLIEYKPKVHLSLHPFWFPEYDKNVNDISKVIFSIYNVFDTTTDTQITPETFKDEMDKMQGYDVLLIAKS